MRDKKQSKDQGNDRFFLLNAITYAVLEKKNCNILRKSGTGGSESAQMLLVRKREETFPLPPRSATIRQNYGFTT